MYARSYSAYGKARAVLEEKFSAMFAYMAESEADQKVYTAAELTAHPFLGESYTMIALAEYCRLTGAAWVHHRCGKPAIHTDNTVEQGFATDKVGFCSLPCYFSLIFIISHLLAMTT